jgi:hypothetical protein
MPIVSYFLNQTFGQKTVFVLFEHFSKMKLKVFPNPDTISAFFLTGMPSLFAEALPAKDQTAVYLPYNHA